MVAHHRHQAEEEEMEAFQGAYLDPGTEEGMEKHPVAAAAFLRAWGMAVEGLRVRQADRKPRDWSLVSEQSGLRSTVAHCPGAVYHDCAAYDRLGSRVSTEQIGGEPTSIN